MPDIMSGTLTEGRATHSLMEKPLSNAVRVVLGLELAAPLIVTAEPLPATMFPYVVGKAVYTRLLIELAFALWLVLVLWHPSYRLPRSRLVWVLAIYVGVVLVASLTGVSLQRSLWSTYERMQGWVGLLHYAAFTVMLASVFRTFRDWRLVLNGTLAVGLVMGLLGLSQMAGLDVLAYLVEAPRISITLGNATYVGAYMLVNALIAAAFLAHSLAAPRGGGDESAGRAGRGSRRGRRQQTGSERPSWASQETLMRVFWVSVIVLDLLMLYQSGTRGAIVGLAAGAGTFIVGYILWGRLKPVRTASIALAVAGRCASRRVPARPQHRRVRERRRVEPDPAAVGQPRPRGPVGALPLDLDPDWAAGIRRQAGARLGTGELRRRIRPAPDRGGGGRLFPPPLRPGAQQGHRGDGDDGRGWDSPPTGRSGSSWRGSSHGASGSCNRMRRSSHC